MVRGGGSAKAVVGRRGLQGYRKVHDNAAFVPDYDNRQKGRPPRSVDDMGGVVLRERGIVGRAGGWGLERCETPSGTVSRGGESRSVVEHDNTPSPQVHKRVVPLSTTSPPSAFLPSHRDRHVHSEVGAPVFRQRL